jgi:hypothetical protein
VTNREIEEIKREGNREGERKSKREREMWLILLDFLRIPKIVNLDARVLRKGVFPTRLRFVFAIPGSPSSSSRLRSGDYSIYNERYRNRERESEKRNSEAHVLLNLMG